MLVVDLCCASGHVFEGWFASADDLAQQQASHVLQCPVCGDAHVQRRPSAAHVVTRAASAPANASATAPAAAPAPLVDGAQGEALANLQRLWLAAAREIVAQTEDVGTRFADEARAIHHGDAPERGIRGQATPQERAALQEEGIEVVSLPLPEGLTKPVH